MMNVSRLALIPVFMMTLAACKTVIQQDDTAQSCTRKVEQDGSRVFANCWGPAAEAHFRIQRNDADKKFFHTTTASLNEFTKIRMEIPGLPEDQIIAGESMFAAAKDAPENEVRIRFGIWAASKSEVESRFDDATVEVSGREMDVRLDDSRHDAKSGVAIRTLWVTIPKDSKTVVVVNGKQIDHSTRKGWQPPARR